MLLDFAAKQRQSLVRPQLDEVPRILCSHVRRVPGAIQNSRDHLRSGRFLLWRERRNGCGRTQPCGILEQRLDLAGKTWSHSHQVWVFYKQTADLTICINVFTQVTNNIFERNKGGFTLELPKVNLMYQELYNHSVDVNDTIFERNEQFEFRWEF